MPIVRSIMSMLFLRRSSLARLTANHWKVLDPNTPQLIATNQPGHDIQQFEGSSGDDATHGQEPNMATQVVAAAQIAATIA